MRTTQARPDGLYRIASGAHRPVARCIRRPFRPRAAGPSVVVVFSLIALAVAFTLGAVQYSQRHGRLLLPPAFDDVGYLLDGATRLEIFHDSGAAALVRSFFADPSHSPYSVLEAFFSFFLFGFRDWAPYAGNAGLVLVFLVFAHRLARGMRAWHKACLGLILLSFPLVAHAVLDCRPDMAAAVLMTGGMFTLLGRPARGVSFVGAPATQKLAAGALFGLAILAKPSVFPAHLAVLANALLAAAVRDWLDPAARKGWRGQGTRPALADLARTWGVVFLPVVVIAGPYFVVGGRSISAYIWGNTFGADSDVWKARLDIPGQLSYYVTGPAAEEMLGGHRSILFVVLLIGAGFYAARRQRRNMLRAAAFAWVVAIGYAVCTINQMKHQFLGLTFQVPMVFLALFALRNMVLSQKLRRQPPWAEALLVGVTVLRLAFFYWPGWMGVPNEPGVRAQWALVEEIHRNVSDHSPPAPAGPARQELARTPGPHVLLTFSGHISATLLNYVAVQKFTPMRCYDLGLARGPEAYVKEFDRADFVVACDPGMSQGLSLCERELVADYIPNAGFQDRILAALRSRTDYVLVATLEYPSNHKNFYVFQKSPYLPLGAVRKTGYAEAHARS